jgi:hypothetical protein
LAKHRPTGSRHRLTGATVAYKVIPQVTVQTDHGLKEGVRGMPNEAVTPGDATRLWYTAPADGRRHALPIGQGRVAAVASRADRIVPRAHGGVSA